MVYLRCHSEKTNLCEKLAKTRHYQVFVCRSETINAQPQKILREAKRLIKEARKACVDKLKADGTKGNIRAFIRSTRPKKEKFYIDDFHYHIEESHDFSDMVGRYRFMPCVFELIRFSKNEFISTEKDNYALWGLSADNLGFQVIVRKEKSGYALQSFFPVDIKKKENPAVPL